MNLVTPDIGLLFWMVLSFSIVLILLRKFAWNPILRALREREMFIQTSVRNAEKARDEMERLKTEKEKIIAQAKMERNSLIKEAREIKEKIIVEAKENASNETAKMIHVAKATIESQKQTALEDMKNQIANLSVDIAEKILMQSLAKDEKQQILINNLLDEIRLN